MNKDYPTRFETEINEFDEFFWFETLENLLPQIHEVDRIATQIWFRFYPLSLHRALESAENRDEMIQGFVMQGDFELKTQIDSSHKFLYGHRYWADVKHAILERTKSFENGECKLEEEILMLAKSVANGLKQDASLLIGITAVGLMTLVQVGLEAFRETKGEVNKPQGILNNSPEKVLGERQKDDKQGLLGFLKTVDKEFSVTWDETDANAKFNIIFDEEVASAAARDQSRNWLEKDERCGEGVIPVECRAAACGTCWVGVVGGAEKLSDVQRMERKQMKVFGYKQGDEEKPFMRLACQAQAEGSVSIVIPPWNGVFGNKIYGVKKVELEPATTSAKKLRETIDEALTISENN